MEQFEHKFKIFSCKGSRYLAEKIAASLKTELGKSEVTMFSDGEFQPAFTESVRGATVSRAHSLPQTIFLNCF